MKNLVWILILVLATSSCSLFQKPSMSQEEIDAMTARNQSLERQLSECENLEAQLAAANARAESVAAELAELQEAIKGKYQIIVGAFKISSNATEYSQTIKNAGYEGKIVAGFFGFDLVTYSSHESFAEALRALDEARINVIETAWVYVNR